MADPKIAAQIEFHLARATALNAYAAYEHSLAHLFDALMAKGRADTQTIQRNYLVFAQILSYRHRRQMISDLIEMKHPGKYDIFVTSLMKKLARLESDRNKLVHWIVMVSQRGGEQFTPKRDIALHAHPDMFQGERIFLHEIHDFEKRSDFCRLLVFYFANHLRFGSVDDFRADNKTTWSEIFRRRVEYPPPTDHPLHPIGEAHSVQLLSWRD